MKNKVITKNLNIDYWGNFEQNFKVSFQYVKKVFGKDYYDVNLLDLDHNIKFLESDLSVVEKETIKYYDELIKAWIKRGVIFTQFEFHGVATPGKVLKAYKEDNKLLQTKGKKLLIKFEK